MSQEALIDQIGTQLPTSVVGPMLLFLYLFLVLVVLLNLLIAQMVRRKADDVPLTSAHALDTQVSPALLDGRLACDSLIRLRTSIPKARGAGCLIGETSSSSLRTEKSRCHHRSTSYG